jgi:hypothetical protein
VDFRNLSKVSGGGEIGDLLRASEVLQQASKTSKRWSTEKASQQISYAVLSIGYEWNLNYCHMRGSDVVVRGLVCHS